MGIRTHLFIKCISIITALTTSSAACFSTPSATKEVNDEVLAIQIEQAVNAAVVKSNLLTEDGQSVLINDAFSEKIIPITVSCENVNLSKDTTLTAEVTAFSSDESRMSVVLDKQEVVLDGTEQTINLVINRNDYAAPEDVEESVPAEDEQPVEELPEEPIGEDCPTEKEEPSVEEKPVEEVPAVDVEATEEPEESEGPVYQLPTIEELEKENEKELGILELPVIITGVSITVDAETVEETPEVIPEEIPSEDKTETILPEAGENTAKDDAAEEQPKDGDVEAEVPGTEEPPIEGEVIPEERETPKKEQPENEKEPEEDVEDEETKEEERPLTAWVILTLGEKTFSAVFVVDENDTDQNAVGELQYCPSQYHPTGQVNLVNNPEIDTIVGEFPAMTKYTVCEASYTLYDGGMVRIPAGESLKLDLSAVQIENNLEFCSLAGTAYSIRYVEKPNELKDTTMIIVDGAEKSLPVSYQWGELTPEIIVEHLAVSKDGLKWNLVDNITCKEDGKGKIQIIPKSSEAGTYRIKVLWNENEISLYQLNIPFYVQCASADQGGTGQ